LRKGREDAQSGDDDMTLARIADRANAHRGKHDATIAALDAEIARLEGIKGGFGSAPAERARIISAKRAERDRLASANSGAGNLLPGDLEAFSRDQLRRAGLSDDGSLPANIRRMMDDAAHDAAERNRQTGLTARTSTPLDRPGRPVRNAPLPPRRPDELNSPADITFPAQAFDEAAAKADEVKTKVVEIGPAAMTATQQVAAGMSAAVNQAIADVARLQQALNSLRAPSLSFAGLNTGRTMNEVR
jgi:hypothetical protein